VLVPLVPPLLLQLPRLEVLHLPHLFPPSVELMPAPCLPPVEQQLVEPPLRPILSQVPPVPLVPLVLLPLYLPQVELPEPLLYLQQAPTLQHLSVQQLVQVQALMLLSHHPGPQLVLLPPPVPHHRLLPQPAQQLFLLQPTLPVKEPQQKLAHLAPPKASGLALTELTTNDVHPVSGLPFNLWLLAQLAQRAKVTQSKSQHPAPAPQVALPPFPSLLLEVLPLQVEQLPILQPISPVLRREVPLDDVPLLMVFNFADLNTTLLLSMSAMAIPCFALSKMVLQPKLVEWLAI
jgi:hypothetical protein